MTQKELLYLEDAISHETAIIKICNDTLERLEDEELISFMEDEIEIHKSIKKNLIKKLEECNNE